MDRVDLEKLSGYLFVHVGCPAVKEDEFLELYRLGFKVLILDDVGIKPKRKCFFEYQKIEFSNVDSVVSTIQLALDRLQLKLGAIFTLADGSVDFTNEILKALKQNPVYRAEIESVRNKYLMRKALEKSGFTLPVCDLVDPGDVPKQYPAERFPLIVKPVDSMSSRSVRLVNNQDELMAAIRLIQTESTEVAGDHGPVSVEKIYRLKRQALLESYLTGDEFSAEVILHNREVVFKAITSKVTSGSPYFTEKGHIGGLLYDEDFEDRVNVLINAVIDAGQFDTTVLHIEFKRGDDGGVNLIECNARMGGDQICSLTEKATGCNILTTFLKLNVGLATPSSISVKPKKVILRYFITTDRAGSISNLLAAYGQQEIKWWYNVGDTVGLLGSERATRLGAIEGAFATNEDVRAFLRDLITNEGTLYQIVPEKPDGGGPKGSGNSIGTLARKKLNSIFLIGTVAVSLIFALSVALTLGGYQSQYIKLFGENLSSSIQQYMSFREILPIAFRISKADPKGWCKRIVVVDNDSRVLYSTSQTGFPTEQVFTTIDRKGFDFSFPVQSNGVTEGYVLIDRGYGRVLGIFATLSTLFLLLVTGVYQVFVRVLLPAAFTPFESGIEQLEAILSGLAVELDGLGDRTFSRSLILSSYRKQLDNIHTNVKEIAALKDQTDLILTSISKIQSQINDSEKLKDLFNESQRTQELNLSIGEVMAQVAHDIRSPLSALEILSSSLDSVSEDKRILLRTAVRRISDIAQGLSLRGTRQQIVANNTNDIRPPLKFDRERASVELLSSLVSEIISEKRLQYSGMLELDFEITRETYGLFAKVQPIEFKRVISNLIDNSVEAAIGDNQRIIIGLKGDESSISITVRDFGRGIRKERLELLGCKGVTFDKPAGSGLGLYHAKKRIAEWNGSLAIESEVNLGTVVTIHLPKANPPKWFLSKLVVPKKGLISIVDDDETIHQIWNQRLGSIGLQPAQPHSSNGLLHFSGSLAFSQSQTYKRSSRQLFLIDYELLGQEDTGLDIIEKLQLPGTDCVLVTSHWNEPHIRRRCERLAVRLLPKNLAQHVEIGFC